MKRIKPIVARNAGELATALGLPSSAGVEFEVRHALNSKIIEVVEKRGLTHAEAAKLAQTSRTRLTAIMNRNCEQVSIDLMLRILGALGVSAKISFGRAA